MVAGSLCLYQPQTLPATGRPALSGVLVSDERDSGVEINTTAATITPTAVSVNVRISLRVGDFRIVQYQSYSLIALVTFLSLMVGAVCFAAFGAGRERIAPTSTSASWNVFRTEGMRE